MRETSWAGVGFGFKIPVTRVQELGWVLRSAVLEFSMPEAYISKSNLRARDRSQ